MSDLNLAEMLRALLRGEDLASKEIHGLFGAIMDGDVSDVWKTAFLVALAAKGESVGEIGGAARAMRERSLQIPHHQERLLDTCGTGGDGSGSLNISTSAALVAAGAGARVAKHGNRAASSLSGSADVLGELGVALDAGPEAVGRALDEVGIAFLFAAQLHPAMGQVVPIRKELGVRTIFNALGPLTNPAGAKRQLMGVYSAHLVEPVARVLGELGGVHCLVVHGQDGMDEITTTSKTTAAEMRDGEVRVFEIEPEDFGIGRATAAQLAGGTPAENAVAIRRLLEDREPGAYRDITILNAGWALYVGGVTSDPRAGVEAAQAAIDDGCAAEKLHSLVAATGRSDA